MGKPSPELSALLGGYQQSIYSYFSLFTILQLLALPHAWAITGLRLKNSARTFSSTVLSGQAKFMHCEQFECLSVTKKLMLVSR